MLARSGWKIFNAIGCPGVVGLVAILKHVDGVRFHVEKGVNTLGEHIHEHA